MSKQLSLSNYFEKGFIEKHAGKIITQPEFALVELVANSWDAGAEEVKIKIPEKIGEIISIEDNGVGMTQKDFESIWPVLSYNRIEHQGKEVKFPNKKNIKRMAYGRNGKGRHAMFCFSDSYNVETWKDGISSFFTVKKTHGEKTLDIWFDKKDNKAGSGTKIYSKVERNIISHEDVKDLLGSKFIVDPSFRLFVNEDPVEFTDLDHLIKTKINVNTNYGNVEVRLFDTKSAGRTTLQYGVAWWVNGRLVGRPSWGRMDGKYIDGRTSEAKRYTFIIMADILKDSIKKDWSGFKQSKKYQEVLDAVEANIAQELQKLFYNKRKERKKNILTKHRDIIKHLSFVPRTKIANFIDNVQENCPTLGIADLNNISMILINLENANSGYDLLDKLAKISPDDVDGLNEILSEWSIQDAKMVLDELDRRLQTINNLKKIINKKSDELHQIHPIFERGLWIFGPEFESVHFTSNRAISNVLRELLKIKVNNPIRDRPDIVALPDNSTLSLYSSDSFDNNGDVNGISKILIIELKHGNSTIKLPDLTQGLEYAVKIRSSGKVRKSTNFTVYVIGNSVSPEIEEPLNQGNVNVNPTDFETILRRAHGRTFNLQEKIKKFSKLKDDEDIQKELKIKDLDDFVNA